MKKNMFALLCLSGSLIGCLTVQAPPMIDRHTIMESEAAGEWPELEKEFLQQSRHSGPIPFPKENTSARKKRVYRVLNEDLVGKVE